MPVVRGRPRGVRDLDGDRLTVRLLKGPGKGVLAVRPYGSVRYRPPVGLTRGAVHLPRVRRAGVQRPGHREHRCLRRGGCSAVGCEGVGRIDNPSSVAHHPSSARSPPARPHTRSSNWCRSVAVETLAVDRLGDAAGVAALRGHRGQDVLQLPGEIDAKSGCRRLDCNSPSCRVSHSGVVAMFVRLCLSVRAASACWKLAATSSRQRLALRLGANGSVSRPRRNIGAHGHIAA